MSLCWAVGEGALRDAFSGDLDLVDWESSSAPIGIGSEEGDADGAEVRGITRINQRILEIHSKILRRKSAWRSPASSASTSRATKRSKRQEG